MSTPRYVWAALDAAKARRLADEAERVALAERDDDVGGELAEREERLDSFGFGFATDCEWPS